MSAGGRAAAQRWARRRRAHALRAQGVREGRQQLADELRLLVHGQLKTHVLALQRCLLGAQRASAAPQRQEWLAAGLSQAGRLLAVVTGLHQPGGGALLPGDLEQTIADIAASLAVAHPGCRCQVEVTGLAPAPIGDSLRRAITLVLYNALSNAYAHGQPGAITIQLQYAPDALVLLVRDDGRGIAGARQGAQGRGLRDMAALVAAQRGALRIVSDGATGTEIHATFPLCAAHAAPGEPMYRRTLPPGPAVPPGPAGPPPAASWPAPRRRVLVIDDHPPIRDWVRDALAPYQIAVVPARSGEEALALVGQGERVDAAICDVLMPHAEVEGIAAARALWYEHGIPCLILTSVQEAGTRLAAIYSGALGYLLKDMAETELLVRSVLTVLQGQRPHDPLAAVAISAAEARQIAEAHAAYLRAIEQLTPQQRVVARLILEGKTNPEIAEELVLSRATINTHVSNILQRLNLATRRDVKARVLLSYPGPHSGGGGRRG